MSDQSMPLAFGAETPASTGALPDGWEIAEYSGKGGRALFAVYAQGRRLASGMTSETSASRWARMLAASRLWPVA